jgi:hypothetical protein
MKSALIGYHNQDFVFSADIAISTPESGFLFHIGRSGEPFYPVISFSGNNGYLFDQSGHFVGGYRKFEPITISGNFVAGEKLVSGNITYDDYSVGRLSYYINNVLIANNITGPSGYFDTILFDDQSGKNTLAIEFIRQTGSPNVLTDNTFSYLLSSDGHFLAAND